MNKPVSDLEGARNQRREQRFPLQTPLASPLMMRLPGQRDTPVVALRNVSAGGACVLVTQPLQKQQALVIALRVGGARMEFSGQVAWCRPAEPQDIAGGSARHADGGLYAVGLMIHGPGSFAAMVQMAGTN